MADTIHLGQMRHRVGIYAATRTRENDGSFIKQWGKLATVWALVEHLEQDSGEEKQGGRVQSIVRSRITIRYLSVVRSDMRVEFDGRYYNIQTVLPDVNKTYTVMEAILTPDAQVWEPGDTEYTEPPLAQLFLDASGSTATVTEGDLPTDGTRIGVYRNGIRLTESVDYTITGQVVTFTTALDGDTVLVTWSAPLTQAFTNASGASVTVTRGTLPENQTRIGVYRNGVRLAEDNNDYSIDGQVITFTLPLDEEDVLITW